MSRCNLLTHVSETSALAQQISRCFRRETQGCTAKRKKSAIQLNVPVKGPGVTLKLMRLRCQFGRRNTVITYRKQADTNSVSSWEVENSRFIILLLKWEWRSWRVKHRRGARHMPPTCVQGVITIDNEGCRLHEMENKGWGDRGCSDMHILKNITCHILLHFKF